MFNIDQLWAKCSNRNVCSCNGRFEGFFSEFNANGTLISRISLEKIMMTPVNKYDRDVTHRTHLAQPAATSNQHTIEDGKG